MTTYKITYDDGDIVYGRINATEQEVRKLFPIGHMQNVGLGPEDCLKRITGVEIKKTVRESNPFRDALPHCLR